jgi:hypothetical protein
MTKRIAIARMTTDVPESGVVVFLLGSVIKKWWAVHRWLPVALAFMRMMRELRTAKVPGFLGVRGSGPVTIMYWASSEALIAFAHDRTGTHLPAWADYNKRIRASGAVGIWHETFVVPGHGVESVYVDVAPEGLGAIFPLVPATGRRETQRGRLGGAVS